jgi:hypothetical protein
MCLGNVVISGSNALIKREALMESEVVTSRFAPEAARAAKTGNSIY